MGDDFSPARVALCAKALAEVLRSEGGDTVVVGWDTRKNSQTYARAAASVLAREGFKVRIFDRVAPTPACAWYAKKMRGFGVMITASHNPPEWNGFKVKTPDGGPLPADKIAVLEQHIARLASDKFTNLEDIANTTEFNPLPDYLNSCSKLVDLQLTKKAGLNVIVDNMYGCGANSMTEVLGEYATVRELRADPDPDFPNMRQPEPTAPNLAPLIRAVKNETDAIGIAFDGDADRLGVVDASGEYLSTFDVFALLVHHQLSHRAKGDVATTLTMSAMTDALVADFGAQVIRTPVGFKHIAPFIINKRCVIGGEESGGYAISDHIADRDGLACALILLEMVAISGKSPKQLLEELQSRFGRYTYARKDIALADETLRQRLGSLKIGSLGNHKVVNSNTDDGLKLVMESGSWVACRVSGTEPLIRIYAETVAADDPATLIQEFTALLGAEGGI